MLDFALRSFNGLKHTARKSWCSQLTAQLHAWGGCRGHAILINNAPSPRLFLKQAHLVSDWKMGTGATTILTTPSPGSMLLATRWNIQMNMNTWLVSRNLQNTPKMFWRADIGLSPDLFASAFLQTWKKTQLPWTISGLIIRILEIVSWEWLETVRKIWKTQRLLLFS